MTAKQKLKKEQRYEKADITRFVIGVGIMTYGMQQ
jgi:hypothetical protein